MSKKKRETQWSHLPPEIARSIAELLPAIDLPRFRSVCRSWNSAAEGLTPSAPVSLFPWLCLVSSGDQTFPSFFSRPENRYHHFCLSPAAGARLVGGRDGWMVYLFNDDLPVLINPLTRTRRYLPPLASLWPLTTRGSAGALKIVLSAAPSSPAASVLAVSLFDDRKLLALSRLGDDSWTPLYPLPLTEYKLVVPDTRPVRFTELIQDVIYHDRRFFALLRSGRMLAFDISAGPAASLLTYEFAVAGLNGFVANNNSKGVLLCSAPCGDLLHVRWKGCAVSKSLTNIAVMKLNPETNSWTEVEDLCGGSLFLGCDQAVMLRNVPELKRNCVYFTDDYCNPRATAQVVRVYDLVKGTVEPFFSPLKLGGPDDVLTWFTPSLS